MIKILVDTLGGDKSPAANVEGALRAVREIDDLSVVLVGNTKDNLALLSGDYDRSRVEFIDALGVISVFIRFGDFDITGYVFRRGVKKDVKSFREYKKDKEDERKETFNYPLFFGLVFLLVSGLVAFLCL